jgi:glucose/arabinose dehydrogenase
MKKLLSCLLIIISVSVFAQPNNTCASATLITTDSTCITGTSRLTAQTLTGGTYVAGDLGTTTSACTFVASPDVWYKFIAKTKNPTVSLSGLGTGWGTALKIQLLSGSCGSFTEVACGNNTAPTATFSVTPANTNLLIPGNTYYIRIHSTSLTSPAPVNLGFTICVTDPLERGSRMNEIFSQTVLSPAGVLQYPWEITYGPDDSLWITEARGYKVYKMNSVNGGKRVVLDLSFGSTWFGAAGSGGADTLYVQQSVAAMTANPNGWPQGGFAGLALHPQFGDGSHNFVYVTYIHRYLGGTAPNGIFYRNKLVRFTYNTAAGRLESPSVLLNNLPGSQDHNSQRLVIAPEIKGGTPYLFMGQGDMGAGQFGNRYRNQNSQDPNIYEGKILRLNLESDNPVTGETDSTQWIPNDNPYAAGKSAVWSIGVRNNQGFAYDTASNILYATSHGPYSDDEMNIIERNKNYGHPLVIGYVADGNYNGTTTASGSNTNISAGSPYNDATAPSPLLPAFTALYNGKSTCPPIGNEATNAATIGASYKDPLFSAYAPNNATILTTWQTNPANSGWKSEGWSGLDLYSNKMIPGWNKSVVASGLKWGRLIRLKLGATGTTTLPSNVTGSNANEGDTITYFQSTNRYRDLAFSPNGKDIFLVMDNSSATSGPGVGNPTVAACPGCVIKYTFLGYDSVAVAPGVSKIPKSIDVTTGAVNTCNAGTTINIDGSNNFLWVPITGPDGNILAEINANGNNLGLITSSFYKHSGSIRNKGGVRYLDRNITITPQFQPTLPSGSPLVKIRLYISKAEFDALDADAFSGLTGTGNINLLKILKNNDPCRATALAATNMINPTNTVLADLQHGPNGYVLQADISGFSSFYFGTANVTLPLDLLTFTGSLQNNATTLLKWQTENEVNTSHFEVERSIDGNGFSKIGTVNAAGNNTSVLDYSFIDKEAANQQSLVLYYRLKMADINGTFKYSNVITISLADITGRVTVMPNPVTNEARVTVAAPEDGRLIYKIIDNAGRTVLQKSMQVRKGAVNSISVDMSKLSTGMYYLNVTGAGMNSNTKLQKL